MKRLSRSEKAEIRTKIQFKFTKIPTPTEFKCENCGSWTKDSYAATTNQTNSIWILCRSHMLSMGRGEVWWSVEKQEVAAE